MTLIVQNESTAGLFISSWLQYPYEFERLERKDGVMVKKRKSTAHWYWKSNNARTL